MTDTHTLIIRLNRHTTLVIDQATGEVWLKEYGGPTQTPDHTLLATFTPTT